MTTDQIITRARAKMLETEDDILTDDTLYLYANEVELDLRIRVFPNQDIESATVNFTNGVGTLPADFGTLYGDPIDAAKNPFPEIPINDFARMLSGNAVTIENGQIKVSPNTTGSLIIRYYPKSVTLSTSQNPTLPAYFHECYIYGILARAYEDLQDESLAKYYDDKYEQKVEAKMSNYSNFEEGNQRGGQMFNDIDILGGNGWSRDPNYF